MDRIEKTVTLKAGRAKVWKALTDAQEFGSWFAAKFDGPFSAGERQTGQLTVKGYEHLRLFIVVEALEAQSRFAFRWHPYAVDEQVDYSKEPMTLVEFFLEDAGSGTRLTVHESGFDALPEHRRAIAFRMNSGGWEEQLHNVSRHVGG
ncbi:MAG: vanillate O-demethylase oxidoreductase VanB [Archangium gephyra]|uniref:Vanillate O-demethylase oxidoreductase VanB n=1 Tax=Archangium gephyra TaxID=48 RepID=A0A2W5T931_9BACT|nr:MAG: vanillate O-demethylase oxidoreductase VanB [Archangium gephyra]